MGERFIVKVWTNGQKHGFCQADIHFNSGITPCQLCNLGCLFSCLNLCFLICMMGKLIFLYLTELLKNKLYAICKNFNKKVSIQ